MPYLKSYKIGRGPYLSDGTENRVPLVDVLQEQPDARQAQHEKRPVHDPLVVLESRGPRKERVLWPVDPENHRGL